MSGTAATEQVWTEEEIRKFWQTVGTFRDGLPPRQREAFNAIVAGAAEVAERGGGGDQEADAFTQTLSAFRESLSPRQRDAFTSVVAAGGAELSHRGAGEDDVQGYVAIAIMAVPLVLYGGFFGYAAAGGFKTRAEAPDLSSIPPSPEEPD